jgi:hypothetical protein
MHTEALRSVAGQPRLGTTPIEGRAVRWFLAHGARRPHGAFFFAAGNIARLSLRRRELHDALRENPRSRSTD